MKIASLLVLDAFVRLGGTGEAAQGLGLTQSAVIKALRLAERELDLDLVSTVQGRLMPTPEALALRQQAQGAFGALRRAQHEADMIRVGMAQRLRIATVPGLAHSILPLAITQARMVLGDDTPVEIMFDHVADHLRAGEADLAISYGPLRDAGLVNLVLGESPLVCVLAHEHALASHGRLGRAELLSQRLISYAPDGFNPADSFQLALTQAGLASRIAIGVRHTDTACHLARQGIGVAIVDGFVISSGLTDGLAVIELNDSPRVAAYAHHHKGPLERAAGILLHCLGRQAA